MTITFSFKLLFAGCLLLQLNLILVEAGRDIAMTKCCHEETPFYLQGFDSCRNDSEQSVSWPPLVFSKRLNQLKDITADDFIITTSNEGCPKGQIAESTIQFKLTSDGSVRLEDGRIFKSGQFCLSQLFGSVDIIARFCTPDPCIEANLDSSSADRCIRKCCPNGMVLNSISFSCQSTTSPSFFPPFKNKLGEPVDQSLSSYVVRAGVIPKCAHGFSPLGESLDDNETFYILPNAQIFIPGYPKDDQMPSDFCIDTDDELAQVMALTCFPTQPPTVPDDVKIVLQIYPYVLLFSSVFLIATFIVYCILPQIRRDVHGLAVMCFVASLTSFYIGMATIQLYYTEPIRWFCIGIAIFVHFSYLSTFTWLNVLSYDIFTKFCYGRTNNSRQKRHLIRRNSFLYSIYAWGVPVLIVIIGQIMDNVEDLPSNIIKPGFGITQCWFGSREAFSAYLYGPMTAIIIINTIFFILILLMMIYRSIVDANFSSSNAKSKHKFRVIFSLFLLMGVSWLTEAISFWAGGSPYIWIVPDIINMCTGIFIFVMFVLLKPNFFKLFKAKFSCFKRSDPCPQTSMTDGSRSNSR